MTICPRFDSDTDSLLMDVQHELYMGLVGYLYLYAKECYLRAVRLLGVETELARLIETKGSRKR
uniref:Uncharacterized protein n=1 Tax=Ammonifex degensii TaxID=42838 RepID=A0A7C1IZ73_9THEO